MALDLKHLSPPQIATSWSYVLVLGGIFLLLRSFYRLFFHPLSHIPGPRLAAVTHAVEFYHDVIEKMHEKYGPVVRINPREVHIKDPHFYDEVYAPASGKREKDSHFIGVFGSPTSMIATISHELHRVRRGMLNNFFSKKSVLALSPIIHEKEAKLMKRLETSYYDDAVLRLDDAYSALTADIIMQYSWGVSSGFLDDDNFKNDVREALNELTAFVHINRCFPILSTIMRALPCWVLRRIRPGATALLDMQDIVTRSSARKPEKGMQKTIFDALTDANEGLIVVIAGTETMARALMVASYYIFRDRQLLLKLRNEIRTVMPTPTTKTSWSELEQLPILNSVVNETLRVSHGPIFRSARVAPTESLTYKNIVIPPKTPVSMCSYFVHMDPHIFPQPESFKPEHWIEAADKGQHLNKFIVSFSRGSRNCLGLNLASAELYMTLALIIRRFDIELYESGPNSFRIDREMGLGFPKQGDFSLRAKITKIITE
ncbi:cytochrome P450 [Hypoxylon crocopeplum]|nr:cytochrome P450 [Hypoxylon crocopeplum]